MYPYLHKLSSERDYKSQYLQLFVTTLFCTRYSLWMSALSCTDVNSTYTKCEPCHFHLCQVASDPQKPHFVSPKLNIFLTDVF